MSGVDETVPLTESKQPSYSTQLDDYAAAVESGSADARYPPDNSGSWPLSMKRQDLLREAAQLDENGVHSLPKPLYRMLIGNSYDESNRKKDAYDAIYKARGYLEESGLPAESVWRATFDFFLMWWMIGWLAVLCFATAVVHPGIFINPRVFWAFWLEQVVKTTFMLCVAYTGGYIVEVFNVKVNYTRKLQHFCAYLIPLVMRLFISAKKFQSTLAESVIVEWWGYWFTMLSFFVFIYPIRTRSPFIDRCFSSLDRPEDRPQTIDWITSQIFLGYIIMSLYTTYMTWSGQIVARDLIFIPVIITGIGDGLAEPVGRSVGGRWFRKYKTAALGGDATKYTRSFEGSFTVWITGVIAIAAMSDLFFSWVHVIAALILVPGVSTIAEAYSPHTWDTPFLLSTGAGILWAQTFIPVGLGLGSILVILAAHLVAMVIFAYVGWANLELDDKRVNTLAF